MRNNKSSVIRGFIDAIFEVIAVLGIPAIVLFIVNLDARFIFSIVSHENELHVLRVGLPDVYPSVLIS